MSFQPPIRRSTSLLALPARDLAKLAAWAAAFALVAYVALSAIGFAPRAVDLFGSFREPSVRAEDELPRRAAPVAGAPDSSQAYTVPTRVEIPLIGVDAAIYEPASVSVAALDALLARGAVYYPGSGVLEGGNLFVFGHSTNWPVVRNQAYKTFNGLDKLAAGDSVYLSSGGGKRHEYRVTSVGIAPDGEVLVKFDQGSHRLTLSTCNTFGLKEERVVVEADYVGPAATSPIDSKN